MKADRLTILLLFLLVANVIVGGMIVDKIMKPSNHLVEAGSTEIGQAILTSADSMAEIIKDESMVVLKEETVLEETPESEPEIVYDGMTLEELAAKLDRSLKNEISGKGMLVASYSLEKGVDPYIATAIMLHETGCKWHCSKLVVNCNNVGGQKGKGCGNYRFFPTLDDGIRGFIDNLSRNYFSKGLDTAQEINKKYAEDKTWYIKVNSYVEKIKNN